MQVGTAWELGDEQAPPRMQNLLAAGSASDSDDTTGARGCMAANAHLPVSVVSRGAVCRW